MYTSVYFAGVVFAAIVGRRGALEIALQRSYRIPCALYEPRRRCGGETCPEMGGLTVRRLSAGLSNDNAGF